ncbi:MAG TPA: hypothetical protein PK764_02800, partial [Deltaproteobacteria bacterium]|nr:hypothetical protein [Deltaproteobacteria bacterium]
YCQFHNTKKAPYATPFHANASGGGEESGEKARNNGALAGESLRIFLGKRSGLLFLACPVTRMISLQLDLKGFPAQTPLEGTRSGRLRRGYRG